MSELAVLQEKFLSIQVCAPSDWSDEKVELEANIAHHCGTSTGWRLSTREECAPITCADNGDRTHWVLDA